MSSKKGQDPKPDIASKMEKMTVKDESEQPESSGGRQLRSASKIPVPIAKTSSSKAVSAKPESKKQSKSPARKFSVKKPVEKSGATPSAGGAKAAKSPKSLSWKESKLDIVEFIATKKLGQGAEGQVWKVRLAGSNIEFAVKQIEIKKLTSTAKLEKKDYVRLAKEIANQDKCANASPLILPIFAWSVEIAEGSLWLLSAMPLCAGTLESLIKRDGIQKEYRPYIKLFTLMLAEEVDVLHRNRVVHCDLHPGNIFIYKDPESAVGYRVVLADLGQSVDFSDGDQVKAAITAAGEDSSEREPEEVAADLEKKLQASDLHDIAGVYLTMAYGAGEGLRLNVAADIKSKKGKYHNKLGDLNERCFVLAMVDLVGRKQPLVPAKQVKLLPFFQGNNAAHPDWALDLKTLGTDYKSAFAKGLANYSLKAGSSDCESWTPTTSSLSSARNTTSAVSSKASVYAQEIVLCECEPKKPDDKPMWADATLRNVHDKHFIARACYCGGAKNWYKNSAVAQDALHLAELVDAAHERNREPWCSLVNFFIDEKKEHAIGKKVKEALLEQNVDWAHFDADELQKKIEAVQSKQPKPTSSKQ